MSGLRGGNFDHARGVPARVLAWALMVVAMMVPLVIGAVRTTAARSLWQRRDRAIACFLTGYLGVWLVAGVAVTAALAALRPELWPHPDMVAAAAFGAAALWQLTPFKSFALSACHRTAPLAPDGWRGYRDCASFGFTIGRGCFLSCWVMMLACTVAGHNTLGMVSVAAIAFVERYSFRPDQRALSAVLSGVGLLFATAIV